MLRHGAGVAAAALLATAALLLGGARGQSPPPGGAGMSQGNSGQGNSGQGNSGQGNSGQGNGQGGGQGGGGGGPPTLDEMRSFCPGEMTACEADATCNSEAMAVLTNPTPSPGSDLFNAVAECLITGGEECGAEVYPCWLDDACRTVMWMESDCSGDQAAIDACENAFGAAHQAAVDALPAGSAQLFASLGACTLAGWQQQAEESCRAAALRDFARWAQDKSPQAAAQRLARFPSWSAPEFGSCVEAWNTGP